MSIRKLASERTPKGYHHRRKAHERQREGSETEKEVRFCWCHVASSYASALACSTPSGIAAPSGSNTCWSDAVVALKPLAGSRLRGPCLNALAWFGLWLGGLRPRLWIEGGLAHFPERVAIGVVKRFRLTSDDQNG